MRSNDARYFQVNKPKRVVNLYPEMADAIALTRSGGAVEALDALVHESATEFKAILLACGRTSTDFRRAYRRGSARWNIVEIERLIPRDVAKEQRLSGFTLRRLSREQIRNVKDRREKLLRCDLLLSDPVGAMWSRILGATLADPSEGNLGLIEAIQDDGVVLGNDRADYQTLPALHPDEIGEIPADWPSNEDVLPFAAAQFLRWRDLRDRGVRWEQWRKMMTTPVRMLTAYLDEEDMMVARYCRDDEDWHEHRSQFQARIDRIDVEIGERLSGLASQWDGRTPERFCQRMPANATCEYYAGLPS